MRSAPVDEETLRRAPKVLLHDHLDGALRPATIVELAEEHGYQGLPSTDPDELRAAMTQGEGDSLEDYLTAFEHTVSVMQTAPALQRVAREAVEDLAADGVVYAELRFAPELNQRGGLELDEVLRAVLSGFQEGSRDGDITVRLLVTAMRNSSRALEIAELAVRWRDDDVVGFDIAGPEAGYPPTDHLEAFRYVKRQNFHTTIHAGEGYGLPSIWEAVQFCGAERLGHGVRLVDDIRDGDEPELGRLASFVRDRRIALEMCPTSNVHTGAAPSIAEHPIDLLDRVGMRVTVNTDNRLMSDVTMTSEFAVLRDAFGYGLDAFERFTVNAMKSAFIPFPDRVRMIEGVILPGYAALRDGSAT